MRQLMLSHMLAHRHHGDRWIDFRWQGDLDLVLGAVHPYSHALLYVRWSDLVTQADDELGNLLDVDDVLGVLWGVWVDDLGAAGHLQRLLLLHHLLVGD